MIYLDTNILIYLLERHEPYSSLVADTLEKYAATNNMLVSSVVAVTEFLAGTTSGSLGTLKHIPRLEFIMLEENLAEQAAILQKDNKMQIGDAIHLASAIYSQSELLFTNDRQLSRIALKYMPVKTL
jgi:predicted nucleic acid-binding protein